MCSKQSRNEQEVIMTPENSIQNFPGFPRISQDFPGFPRIFQNEYCDFIKKMASMCFKQSRNEQEVIMTLENSSKVDATRKKMHTRRLGAIQYFFV